MLFFLIQLFVLAVFNCATIWGLMETQLKTLEHEQGQLTEVVRRTDILQKYFSFFFSFWVSVPQRTCISRAAISVGKRSGRGGQGSVEASLTRAPFCKKQQHPRKVWHRGCAGKHFQKLLKFTIACLPPLPFFCPRELVYFACEEKYSRARAKADDWLWRKRELHGCSWARETLQTEK